MKRFFSKVLLFGEYSILEGSGALIVPFKHFSAYLQYYDKIPPAEHQQSNTLLKEFYEFLWEKKFNLKFNWNLERFKDDLEKGLFLASSIPQHYGLGSSGAVVAAIYDAYAQEKSSMNSPLILRAELAEAESFFHGKSSGTDPLAILFEASLMFTANAIEKFEPEILTGVKSNFYLFDTEIESTTANLVESFAELLNESGFRERFREEYLPDVNSIIAISRNSDSSDFAIRLFRISAFQFRYFSKMIPDSYRDIWQKGLDTGDYLFKLCGSGGGGYLLVYSNSDSSSLEEKLGKKLLPLYS